MKTNGWWVYVIKTPNNMYYVGYSGGKDGTKQKRNRWCPTHYKNTTLEPYIIQFDWKFLEKIIVTDNLTEDEAVKLEGRLINMYKQLECCINKMRSGNIHKDKKKYNNLYYQENKEKLKEQGKLYYQEHQKERNKYMKKHLSTPEGKIYHRVTSFNRYHPDKIIETPLEAKNKYLEYGYIPSYIKNDDLV